jgi:hypothetical protein
MAPIIQALTPAGCGLGVLLFVTLVQTGLLVEMMNKKEQGDQKTSTDTVIFGSARIIGFGFCANELHKDTGTGETTQSLGAGLLPKEQLLRQWSDLYVLSFQTTIDGLLTCAVQTSFIMGAGVASAFASVTLAISIAMMMIPVARLLLWMWKENLSGRLLQKIKDEPIAWNVIFFLLFVAVAGACVLLFRVLALYICESRELGVAQGCMPLCIDNETSSSGCILLPPEGRVSGAHRLV